MTDKEKGNRVNALAMTFLEELQMRPHPFADQILRAYKAGYHQSEKDSLPEEPDWLQELQDKLDSLSKEDFEKVWAKYHQKEEPVSEPIDFEQELYKAFGQVKDFTLGMRIAKWFYDMGKNSQEPVSEELEKVFNRYSEDIESVYSNDMFDRGDIFRACKYGAQCQKQQFEKNRLKHCNSITNEQAELEQGFIDQHLDKYNRMPTFFDAIEYGMRLQKEQMMRGATDGQIEIGEDYLRIKCLCMSCPPQYDGKLVRLIIIREGLL